MANRSRISSWITPPNNTAFRELRMSNGYLNDRQLSGIERTADEWRELGANLPVRKAGSRLPVDTRHAGHMDADDPNLDIHRLTSELLLEAGRIMEDESPELALRLPLEGGLIFERLKGARQAGDDIAQLVAAAQVLQRRYGKA